MLCVPLRNCHILFEIERNFPIQVSTLFIMIGISTILKRTLHPGVNIIFPFWKDLETLAVTSVVILVSVEPGKNHRISWSHSFLIYKMRSLSILISPVL